MIPRLIDKVDFLLSLAIITCAPTHIQNIPILVYLYTVASEKAGQGERMPPQFSEMVGIAPPLLKIYDVAARRVLKKSTKQK